MEYNATDNETRRPLGFVQVSLPECFFDPLPEEELEGWE